MRVLRGLLLGVLVLVGVLACGAQAWASGGGVFESVASVGVVPSVSGEPPVVGTEGASGVGETTATLNGSVNPNEEAITDCHFAYVDEAKYQPEAADPYAEGGVVPCSSIPSGSEPAQVSAEVSGLSGDTRYHFQLYAMSGAGEVVGGDQSFATQGSPTVAGLAVSEVGAAKATVSVQVDPHGLGTMYRFQYGTSEAYGLETAEAEVSGEEPVEASAKLTGLTPGSEYHVRVVVTNSAGSEQATLAFRALPVGVQGLPDKRVFEMVTPHENENANVYVPQGEGFGFTGSLAQGLQSARPFRVSVDGDRVVYVAQSADGGNGEDQVPKGNNYVASHSPDGGWTQTNIEPPGRTFPIYQGFSSDLSTGVLTSGSARDFGLGAPPLSPEAPGEGYSVLYERSLGEDVYRPFFTKSPLPLTPLSGKGAFGAFEGGEQPVMGRTPGGSYEGSPVYAGSSADFSQSLFEANGAFTANAVYPPVKDGDELYDRMDGKLSLVNVLPDGMVEANASFGAPSLEQPRHNPPDFSHVISEDGSRVFWTDLNTGVLYVSEGVGTSAARTVQVDASQGPGEGGGGRFWTASSDGSVVFFTDCSRLTVDSTAVSGGSCARGAGALSGVDPGSDLYEYNVESGQLSDLTVDHNPSDSLAADVQGVIGASDNGEYVYFVAEGELAADATPEAFNLYAWHAGVTTFIATLSSEDGSNVGPYDCEGPGAGCGDVGDWQPGLGRRTAEVTGDGQGLVFMSNQSLKTYPSGRAYPNDGLDEVYTYDAAENHLFCVSCSPTGEAPPARNGGAAAYLPVSWSYTFIQRWISEDGSRVFFDGEVPLVAQDTNGTQDAYEWERDGAGSCREVAGCVYLLTGGTSPTRSWLLGTSASGDDVFVVSRAQLSAVDRNENFDLYDARVEGVAQSLPTACSGSECQETPSTPLVAETPSSATFTGPGNPSPPLVPLVVKKKTVVRPLTRAQKLAKALAACGREHGKHRRVLCKARARKRYGAVSGSGKLARKVGK